jgi:hypothetical protein
MQTGRSILLATLGLIAAACLAAAQEISPNSTEPPPSANAPADPTVGTRPPLGAPAIHEGPGAADNAYDFDTRGSMPAMGPMDRSDRRVPCANSACSPEPAYRT